LGVDEQEFMAVSLLVGLGARDFGPEAVVEERRRAASKARVLRIEQQAQLLE
jgi:hypothetical protein